ncbi:MAG: hypothetical protein AAGG48_30730 [Planctomycetota bacterium]
MARTNPYQTPIDNGQTIRNRPVRSLVIGGIALTIAAGVVAIPGAYFFNEEAQLIPTMRGIYDVQIGAITITNTAVIAFSGILCFCLWSTAAGLWGIARRNHFLNKH